LIHGDLATLRNTVGPTAKFDLVVMMFGVLGHIPSWKLRQETLATVRSQLRPGGKMVVTVPNALRRFRKEQRQARPLIEQRTIEAGDILYRRTSPNGDIDLYYHLYSPSDYPDSLYAAHYSQLASSVSLH
jgi:SAM-dependent methyltransferase